MSTDSSPFALEVFDLGHRLAEVDIIIPSCRTFKELRLLYAEIQRNSTGNFRLLIAANPGLSAAQNRNACLNRSRAPYVIMLDDDITNLFPSWNRLLVQELKARPTVSIVSARLVRPDLTPAAMMSSKYQLDTTLEEVPRVPTACVAFRKTAVRFDEHFKGSGFEDNVFCLQMGPRIVIGNRIRLIHKNEMKHQQEHWEYNKHYFEEAYASRPV
jgi:hypothetical protein